MSDDHGINPLKAGDRFGDYVVEKLLGKGGMGTVYLVRTSNGAQFAIKVMHPDKMTHELRSRFASEAEFAREIRHKNLVPVYDFGQDPDTGLCYIIMEYVSGGSLTDMIKKCGRIPPADAVNITMRIAAALDVVHRNGIVHRDVKPDNILFAKDGTPMLTDLGVAKFTDGIMTTMTMTGIIVGTPAYMSPEQLMDSHKIDARSDIYSLGVVLYEMLAGKRPNDGCTAVQLMAKAIRGEPLPNVRTVCPEVSPPIAHILASMCAPQPDERPATAMAAATLLRKAATGKFPVRIKRPTSEAAVSNKNRRGLLLKVVAAVSVAIVACAVALYAAFLYQPKGDDSFGGTAPTVDTTATTDVSQPKGDDGSGGTAPTVDTTATTNVSVETDAKPDRKDRAIYVGKKPAQSASDVLNAEIDGTTWSYTLEDGEAVIWRGEDKHYGTPAVYPLPVGRLVVPPYLDGHKVVAIGNLAFSDVIE